MANHMFSIRLRRWHSKDGRSFHCSPDNSLISTGRNDGLAGETETSKCCAVAVSILHLQEGVSYSSLRGLIYWLAVFFSCPTSDQFQFQQTTIPFQCPMT